MTAATPTNPVTETTPTKAGAREWIGLAVLALACLMYVMDLTVLHLAVPSPDRGSAARVPGSR